jgi:hypothetical protein
MRDFKTVPVAVIIAAIILAYLAAACVVHFKYQKNKVIEYSHEFTTKDTSETQRQDTVHGGAEHAEKR